MNNESLKKSNDYLRYIDSLDEELHLYFKDVIKTDRRLTRQMVSFQANKNRSGYRWYKYKESFSASLVEYLFSEYHIPKGIIFDPFAVAETPYLHLLQRDLIQKGLNYCL